MMTATIARPGFLQFLSQPIIFSHFEWPKNVVELAAQSAKFDPTSCTSSLTTQTDPRREYVSPAQDRTAPIAGTLQNPRTAQNQGGELCAARGWWVPCLRLLGVGMLQPEHAYPLPRESMPPSRTLPIPVGAQNPG